MTRVLFALPLLAALAGYAPSSLAQAKKVPSAAKAPPAARAPAQPKGLGLQDGDRFIFIGDSITHQCLYTQYVEDFFYTRYPNIRLTFRNAGVGGDRAADALARFDDDIASFKPTVATILLGMNDGTYRDFDLPTFKTYSEGMIQLMDKLDALHCKVILMSPTMYDLQAFEKRVEKEPKRANNGATENYNGVLAYYGKWLQETARKRGYLYVDLFSPLNTLTVQQRRIDPAFTMIPDAVHPANDGQLVMAYELLRQTGELGGILGTGIRAVGGEWKPMNPAQVKDISGQAGHTAAYTVIPKCLPWVVPDDAQLGFKLTRAGHTGTQESHIAVGLAAGRYDLIINGQQVGTFDERMLGVHAEIEEDPDSPTRRQAMKIALLNQQRNNEAVHPLRDLYRDRKLQLKAAQQAGDMKPFEIWWAASRAREAELMKKAADFEAEIYKANQVAPLKVEIKPSATVAPAVKGKKAAAKKAA